MTDYLGIDVSDWYMHNDRFFKKMKNYSLLSKFPNSFILNL